MSSGSSGDTAGAGDATLREYVRGLAAGLTYNAFQTEFKTSQWAKDKETKKVAWQMYKDA